MRAWIVASLSCVVVACGGTFSSEGSHKAASVDGGDTGGASAGGSAGGSSAGGSMSAGGATSAGGSVGAGGFNPGGWGGGGFINPGGFGGAGGGPIDCSNVGCGMAPFCMYGCTAPCGCCGCPVGEHKNYMEGDYVCNGTCYELASTPPPPPPIDGGSASDGGSLTCSRGGRTYNDGESFRAGDGCNTCTCASGIAKCTLAPCAYCSPTQEAHQREYIGTDPSQCAVIDFTCPANTTMFANACGCGCEQGLQCPDWFDCMPGPGASCDTNEIKTECPYSGIAF